MPIDQLERSIYALGFYRRKAASLRYVSQELITRFHGKVPSSPEELLSIKGIGRKTANLVLGEAFGIPALCVDTHVHKISNRLGLVSTKTPDQTEWALKKILPQQYWIEYNRLLVVWGQNICVPLSPFCSKCPVFDLCHRVGVIKSR
jgi:endonuclease-3